MEFEYASSLGLESYQSVNDESVSHQSMIHVVGIGLDGIQGLTNEVRSLIDRAELLVGSNRHLSYFPNFVGDRIVLGSFAQAFERIQQKQIEQKQIEQKQIEQKQIEQRPEVCLAPSIVILTSGDPLFFGLGRLLLEIFPPEQITFHPHLSSIQLAFSRIKLPWQDARVVSAHGRSLDKLIPVLQQGSAKVAVLTDNQNTPAAIARLVLSLQLPTRYGLWICENLGGEMEQVRSFQDLTTVPDLVSPLNVVILQRQEPDFTPIDRSLPLFGLQDSDFLSFPDRPGLMTKREVRIQVLAELDLQPRQVLWDIGAGTGSVAVEMARLVPDAQVYAIEKTDAGIALIQKNAQRLATPNVQTISGEAPDVLKSLPDPDRIFIGGSGGNLEILLEVGLQRLNAQGVLVLAIATLEHQFQTLQYLKERNRQEKSSWSYHLLQLNFSRATEIAHLTRWTPLNPVTLITVQRQS
ncbi:precorrin-6y C5,15-methyltransferase (decarboxylating) subunit CbiE [Alkalinema pantanalense CENA528]|uniref:precorrin-6y C5,15-methyltransferase (decarboxylating) subunit CbiE n=1 Tax=Alkalinema pantanalense TaxID=1620705 RepID=UPI003D6ED364